MSKTEAGDVRYVGGWMGRQFKECIADSVSEDRVYFHEIGTGLYESMPERKWRLLMPAKREEVRRYFTPLTDALVEIAMLSGEDWSSYAADKIGTEQDVRDDWKFRRDLLEDPQILVTAVKQLRDDFDGVE